MLKIDTHAHILPPNWPNLADKYADDRFPVMVQTEGRHRIYKDGKFFREVWENAFDAEHRIADYAKFGVQTQVISTVPVLFSYWAKPGQALELHRFLNDHTAELCRTHPRHYAGIGTVPLQSPTLAIQEMERCMEQLGLQGVQIGSHVEQWNLDAPEMFPFFEAAADLGAAILVHPWDMMGRETMPKYWMPWLVGMPAEQSRAALLPDFRRRARAACRNCASASPMAAARFPTQSGASSTASACVRISSPRTTRATRANISTASFSIPACTTRAHCNICSM